MIEGGYFDVSLVVEIKPFEVRSDHPGLKNVVTLVLLVEHLRRQVDAIYC